MEQMENSNLISASEVEIYDRQIRLWGASAQKRLMSSRVLIVGLSAINTESAKNLILSGVSVSLCDDSEVKASDYGYNYFLDKNALHEQMAKGTRESMQAMNSLVKVDVVEGNFSRCINDRKALTDMIGGYTAVCIAAEYHPLHTLVEVDEVLREIDVALFVSFSCGKFGFFFSDMGTTHLVDDNLCNDVDSMSKKSSAVVGSSVQFPSLRRTVSADLQSLGKRTRPIIYSLMILCEYEKRFGNTKLNQCGRTGGDSIEACEHFVGFGHNMLTSWGKDNNNKTEQYALWELIASYRRPFILSASVIGGLLAQEVRKYISRQLTPLSNCTAFNFNTSTATSQQIPPQTA
eukprot:GHVS01045454.1.p1 GENE.GHVS01045454.1~~GHVS01045454.1.p1  ORF type:complete len:348 (+),score=37.28 GHVS01045454.1:135-1178(+)